MMEEVQNSKVNYSGQAKQSSEPWYKFESLNVQKKYENYKVKLQITVNRFIEKFNDAMDSIIGLITVFIINTVIIPLAALWLFIYGLGSFLRRDFLLALD